MECSLPPPLTDEQLALALEGLGDPDVEEHLRRCPGCAQRLAEARAFDQGLEAALARWDCPPPDWLRDYHFGLLDAPGRAGAVAAHLAACPRCAEELADLRAFLAAQPDTAPAPAVQTARRGLGRWLHELVTQIRPLAPAAALRGAARQPLIATVEDLTLILELDRAADGTTSLIGQLIAAEGHERWPGSLVELWQSGDLVASTALDSAGAFRCPARGAGPATLRITAPDGRAVRVPDLEIAPAAD